MGRQYVRTSFGSTASKTARARKYVLTAFGDAKTDVCLASKRFAGTRLTAPKSKTTDLLPTSLSKESTEGSTDEATNLFNERWFGLSSAPSTSDTSGKSRSRKSRKEVGIHAQIQQKREEILQATENSLITAQRQIRHLDKCIAECDERRQLRLLMQLCQARSEAQKALERAQSNERMEQFNQAVQSALAFAQRGYTGASPLANPDLDSVVDPTTLRPKACPQASCYLCKTPLLYNTLDGMQVCNGCGLEQKYREFGYEGGSHAEKQNGEQGHCASGDAEGSSGGLDEDDMKSGSGSSSSGNGGSTAGTEGPGSGVNGHPGRGRGNRHGLVPRSITALSSNASSVVAAGHVDEKQEVAERNDHSRSLASMDTTSSEDDGSVGPTHASHSGGLTSVSSNSADEKRNTHLKSMLSPFEPHDFIPVPDPVTQCFRRFRWREPWRPNTRILTHEVLDLLRKFERREWGAQRVTIAEELNGRCFPVMSDKLHAQIRDSFHRRKTRFRILNQGTQPGTAQVDAQKRKIMVMYSLVLQTECKIRGATQFLPHFNLLKSSGSLHRQAVILLPVYPTEEALPALID
jgi:hypothetical protein